VAAGVARWLGASFLLKLGSVIIGGFLGLGIFYAVCLLFRMSEARDFVRRFLKFR
jgi:hypothetical protein